MANKVTLSQSENDQLTRIHLPAAAALTKFSRRCVTVGTVENDEPVIVVLFDSLFGDDGTVAPTDDTLLVVEGVVGDVDEDVGASSNLN
jgi:hypothetical protein